MFPEGRAVEFLVAAVVALIVVGPKDLPILLRVGLAVAVQDAHPLVVRHAHWQTTHPGGRGAARDVCELILEAQGRLQDLLQSYLAVDPLRRRV